MGTEKTRTDRSVCCVWASCFGSSAWVLKKRRLASPAKAPSGNQSSKQRHAVRRGFQSPQSGVSAEIQIGRAIRNCWNSYQVWYPLSLTSSKNLYILLSNINIFANRTLCSLRTQFHQSMQMRFVNFFLFQFFVTDRCFQSVSHYFEKLEQPFELPIFRVTSVPNLSTIRVGSNYRPSTLHKYRRDYDSVSQTHENTKKVFLKWAVIW